MKPSINVSFYLEGNEFSEEYIREKIRMEPSCFRTKKDWPEAILNWPVYNPDLPDEYKPRTIWELTIGYEECTSVTERLKKVMKQLEGKEEIINQLCKELNLRVGFEVTIRANAGDLPEVYLEKEAVAFIAKIGADISFGIYIIDCESNCAF